MTDPTTTASVPAPARPSPSRKLSPVKWAAGALSFVVVIGGSIWLGYWLSGSPPGGPPAGQMVAAGGIGPIILFGFGLFVFLVGAAAWGVVLATGAFTFNYQRPFMSSYSTKLWLLNILVGLLIEGGFALMVAPLLIPLLLRVMPSPAVAMGVGFFAPFIFAQFLFVWLQMWGPLGRIVITRRLLARGLPREQLALGRFIGTSDPAHNTFKKFGLVEEDLGMLWIGPDRLVFWGDRDAWEIPHDQLVEVERRADAGSTASYFGAVDVILRYRDAAGAERRVRLHPETDWTMTGKARATEDIAQRLMMWQQTPTPDWVSGPSGFVVAGATQGVA
jgi:hypothetical protein